MQNFPWTAFQKFNVRATAAAIFVAVICVLPFHDLHAKHRTCLQDTSKLTWEKAIELALAKHPLIQSARYESSAARSQLRGSTVVPKTEISYVRGQYNSAYSKDNSVTVTQVIPFPSVFAAHRRMKKSELNLSMLREKSVTNEVIHDTGLAFVKALYESEHTKLLAHYDSLCRLEVDDMKKNAKEDAAVIIALDAALHSADVHMSFERSHADYRAAIEKLRLMLRLPKVENISGNFFNDWNIQIDSTGVDKNSSLLFLRQRPLFLELERKQEASKSLPDIKLGYFNTTLVGMHNYDGKTDHYFGPDSRFQGIQIGLFIPIWYRPFQAQAKFLALEQSAAEKELEASEQQLIQKYADTWREFQKNRNTVLYYERVSIPDAKELVRKSADVFHAGKIGSETFFTNLTRALEVNEAYLAALKDVHESLIELKFLSGQ